MRGSLDSRCFWLVAPAIGFLIGCAQSGDLKTAPVAGTVKYKGQTIKNGTVMFVPDRGPAATGEIGPDGRFKLTTYVQDDGAVLGRHKVAITALEDMSGRLPEDQSPLPKPIVPSKYLSQESSGLIFEVKSGNNDALFDLTD